MNPQLRRYIADTGPASLTFFASVIGEMLLAKRVEPGLVRVLVCLIPLPSVLWLAWVEISRLRRRDELRQRIEVEAIAIAFAMSFVIVVTLTFLELGNAFSVQASTVSLVMAACWVAAQIIVRTRFRYWCGIFGSQSDSK